jgi:hypothetical protein
MYFFELGNVLTLKRQLASSEKLLSSMTLAVDDLKKDQSRSRAGERVTDILMSGESSRSAAPGCLARCKPSKSR